MTNSDETREPGELPGELVERALSGDESALAEAFMKFRPRLRLMISLRTDPRLHGRFDSSDVLQESFVELARQLPDFAKKRNVPFHLWLRLVTGQRLAKLHEAHLGAQKRNAR